MNDGYVDITKINFLEIYSHEDMVLPFTYDEFVNGIGHRVAELIDQANVEWNKWLKASLAKIEEYGDHNPNYWRKTGPNGITVTDRGIVECLGLMYPNKLYDEIVFERCIPMRILNIDDMFMRIYCKLTPKQRSKIRSIIAKFPKENVRDTDKVNEMIEDRTNQSKSLGAFSNTVLNPSFRKYRHFVLVSLGIETPTQKLKLSKLIRYAITWGVSTDYLLGRNYAEGDLYTVEDNQYRQLTAEEKQAIIEIQYLSYNQKITLIGNIVGQYNHFLQQEF